MCGAVGETHSLHFNFSCRYEARRCWSELDLSGASAAPSGRPPSRRMQIHQSARLGGLFIVIIAHLFVMVVVVSLFSRSRYLCCDGMSGGRAAVRRLSAALFAARAAAVYVQEAVLQGQCRPLPAWELLRSCAVPCSALLFQGCSGED